MNCKDVTMFVTVCFSIINEVEAIKSVRYRTLSCPKTDRVCHDGTPLCHQLLLPETSSTKYIKGFLDSLIHSDRSNKHITAIGGVCPAVPTYVFTHQITVPSASQTFLPVSGVRSRTSYCPISDSVCEKDNLIILNTSKLRLWHKLVYYIGKYSDWN